MDKRSGRRLPFVTEDSTPTRGEGLTPINIWLEFLALTRRLVDDRIAVDLTGDFLLSGLFDPLRRNRVLSCSKVKRTESFNAFFFGPCRVAPGFRFQTRAWPIFLIYDASNTVEASGIVGKNFPFDLRIEAL